MSEGWSIDLTPQIPERPAHSGAGLREVLARHSRWNDRYEGWTELGSGSYATVVRTFCKDLGEHVAVKVFHHLDQRRFQIEARVARQLESPAALRVYSPFWDSPPWLEMEYVDGPNLKQELERRADAKEPFTYVEALDIGIELTSVLVEAHRKKLLHRDVKPANILLPRTRTPLVKLADFGVSKDEAAPRMTLTGAFAGTPQFGSPESFIGEEPVGPPHDVYGLGLCLYLLFTNNRFPWKARPGAGPRFFMSLHVGAKPRSARFFAPDLDLAADYLVLKCLEKSPKKRPTAAQVLDALRSLRADHKGERRCARRPAALRRRLALIRLWGRLKGVRLLR
jgi:serine/threonine protein kinase